MATDPSPAEDLGQLIDETSAMANASLATYTQIAQRAAQRMAGDADAVPTSVAEDLQSAWGTMATDAIRAMTAWVRVCQVVAKAPAAGRPEPPPDPADP